METQTVKKEKRTDIQGSLNKIISSHYEKIVCIMLIAIMISGTVFAADNSDQLWNLVSTLIQKWVTRIGGVVVFVGGIMFGLGWKSDEPDQKTRGINTMAAGGIVIAVAALTAQFFV